MSLSASSGPSASKSARDVITMDAYTTGLKYGAVAGSAVGAGVLAANKFSPAFRTRLGASGKMAIPVSALMATFSFVSERRLVAGARNPDRYLASLEPGYVAPVEKASSLTWPQQLANRIYDHPYRSLASVGVPLVGGIFAYQATNKGIQRSQQIMHTRIYGQGAVVVLLLASMGFHDYMHKHGRFVAACEQEQEQK